MPSFHPHIILIRTAYANCYLIKNGHRSVLVDTGLQRSGRLVIRKIAEEGLQPSDISLIILTHPHYDHCRGARALKQATGAQLLVHRAEEPKFRQGYCRLPRGTTFLIEAWVTMGRVFMPWLAYFPPVNPDSVIDREFGLNEYGIDSKVLHTPGHTCGSLTVIVEGKHAIVGDTMFGVPNRSPFPPFVNDPKEIIRSWKKLIDEGIEYIYPGHGNPFRAIRLIDSYEQFK